MTRQRRTAILAIAIAALVFVAGVAALTVVVLRDRMERMAGNGVDATGAIRAQGRTGNARIEVKSVERVRDVSPRYRGDYLAIMVSVTNISQTAKVDFANWDQAPQPTTDKVILKDNLGNRYHRPLSHIWEAPKPANLHPGESVSGLLVFERPLDRAVSFTLELPRDVVGEAGVVKFEFPASRIVDRRNDP